MTLVEELIFYSDEVVAAHLEWPNHYVYTKQGRVYQFDGNSWKRIDK